MTKNLRAIFSSEFQQEAVSLLEKEGQPAYQLARELGIRRNQFYKWKSDWSIT
ncbi:MAG: transposase [Pseudomonadales bacterium]|nr:transposase [Pseudomonadales bacterium]